MAEQKRGPGRPPGSKNKSKTASAAAQKRIEELEAKQQSRAIIRDEILGIVIIALGVFLVVALQTHMAGKAGLMIGEALKGVFGFAAYLLPYCFILYGILLFARKTIHIGIKSIILLVIIYLMIVLINAGRFLTPGSGKAFVSFGKNFASGIALEDGGVFGMFIGGYLVKWIGVAGLYILAFVVIFICLLLLINTPVSRFFDDLKIRRQRRLIEREERAKERARAEREQLEAELRGLKEKRRNELTPGQQKIMGYIAEGNTTEKAKDNLDFNGIAIDGEPAEAKVKKSRKGRKKKDEAEPGDGLVVGSYKDAPEKLSKKEAAESMLQSGDFNNTVVSDDYEFPPIDLLNRGKRKTAENVDVLREKAMRLEETLQSFNIDAKVTNVTQGPAVTRYEVHPNSGVKVRGIKNLADDIALNMEAKSIRIDAPIPGKPAVGIEIENEKINMVTAREIIESAEFREAKSKISFAVGKDIAGKAIVADLKSMPHLLIAGSTGSGKSVCINTIITSVMYKAKPDEVKLVLIDPKVVELSNYNGIPHLLIPVVTEPAKAAAALNWAVAEMDERYKKFADEGVRDLSSYNKKLEKRKNKVKDGEVLEPMPQIIIIIDELADLMMAAPSQVEESICRLAQKARAAGMHLIVATQRPSVDVITGLIKANIPSRIAFAVSSQVDSRTILDMVGADKLVGKGDMLFNPLGSGKPTRIQGAFISDAEVNDVIQFVKSQAPADEEGGAEVLEYIEKANTPDCEKGKPADIEDELLPDAIELVVSAGQASVSMLQRRFRIGYNRAARLIDIMEARQIVGPSDGSRPRQVLISEADLQNMNEETEDLDL